LFLSRLHFLLTALVSLSLVSCGGPNGDGGATVSTKQITEQLPSRMQGAEKAVNQLKASIDQGLVRNTVILNEYTRAVKAQKPELASLIDNLGRDATTDGAMFKNLQQRLKVLKNDPELFESPAARYLEAGAIIEATKINNFNRSLVDVVNVVADMSNGTLPRLDSLPKAQSLSENRAQDLGAGSQLIGNPAYGQWSQQGGTSVWEWYGMYAMFRDLVGGRSYGYGYWDRHRDWSHHTDVGRKHYGNYRTKDAHKPKTNKYSSSRSYGSNKKSYGGSSRERNKSVYGNNTTSQKKSTSSSSKKSSLFGGSFRNKSTFSRSSFRGK